MSSDATSNGRRPAGMSVDPEWLQYQLDLRGWSQYQLHLESRSAEMTIVRALRGERVRRDAVRRWIATFTRVKPIPGMERALKKVGLAPVDV